MKTYIIPATTVVALQSNQMLAASNLRNFDKNNNTEEGTLINKGASDEAMTRQHGVGSGLWSDMK